MKIFMNGQLVSGPSAGSSSPDPDIRVHVPDGPDDFSIIHGLSVRLGGELSEAAAEIPRQYFADGTVDEFFMWLDRGLAMETNANDIYKLGRYYKPDDGDPSDSVFTSAPVSLYFGKRDLAPASTVPPPSSEGSTGVLPPGSAYPEKRFVIAVQWTVHAEDYNTGAEDDGTPRLKPVLWDYAPRLNGGSLAPLSPANLADANGYRYETMADLKVQVGSETYGPYRNEGWSPIRLSHGSSSVATTDGSVEVKPPDDVRYVAKMRVGNATINTILLATPVLDDVTIFYSEGSAKFLGYVEVR
jgi:hypothetical protein